MRMNRQEIQVLRNESVRFIERDIYIKIILAGDMPVLRSGILPGNMSAVPEKTESPKNPGAQMYEMWEASSKKRTGILP